MAFISDAALAHLRQVTAWPDLSNTRYTVLEEVGRGGMGVVYRARDESLRRDVAIKVINAAGVHATLAERLEREAVVLAGLEHPGIVPVHDTGMLADGRPFYVMKLVRGKSLREHLGNVERLDERLRVFERICEPVAFAHARGVVHRDLKPENVMVGSFGEDLVMDWGVARGADPGLIESGSHPLPNDRPGATRGLTQAGTIIGTPEFVK
jgi:eukaryotic-like serine/threonine-protein kinase